MTIDFERVKRSICGRSILITSWFDDRRGTWQASAPAYIHLRLRNAEMQAACRSRSEAIEQLIADLTDNLNQPR